MSYEVTKSKVPVINEELRSEGYYSALGELEMDIDEPAVALDEPADPAASESFSDSATAPIDIPPEMLAQNQRSGQGSMEQVYEDFWGDDEDDDFWYDDGDEGFWYDDEPVKPASAQQPESAVREAEPAESDAAEVGFAVSDAAEAEPPTCVAADSEPEPMSSAVVEAEAMVDAAVKAESEPSDAVDSEPEPVTGAAFEPKPSPVPESASASEPAAAPAPAPEPEASKDALTQAAETLEECQAAPHGNPLGDLSDFTLIYESRDKSLSAFQDKDGHLHVVRTSRLS